MENVFTYLPLIVVTALFACAAGLAAYRFASLPREKQIEQVTKWLLGAVTRAEIEYGGGTGRIKLSEVYRCFCEEMPWIAKVMTFETFSNLVDDALAEMRALIESNTRVKELVTDADS